MFSKKKAEIEMNEELIKAFLKKKNIFAVVGTPW
jgi:hypothetical protein